ncbi:MAG: hypothetical protein HQK76_21220 [Desulfobacterales bacterium]|nr:hypothetical protein [Desulfobacterales bacterium]
MNRDPIGEIGNIIIKNIRIGIYNPYNEEWSQSLTNENYNDDDESIDINFYQFAFNNALNYIDPNGEWVVLVAFVAAKAVAMVTSYVVLKTTAYTISEEASMGVDTAMKMVVEINASEAANMAAGEVIAVAAVKGFRYFKLCRAASKSSAILKRGKLIIEAGDYSASELRAAEHMAGLGKNVRLRQPTGTRVGGGTSDLLVDNVRYDVYTPTTAKPKNIISQIAKKNKQAEGIVLDLSDTVVTPDQLGNILKRVQNAGATNIKDIIIIGK